MGNGSPGNWKEEEMWENEKVERKEKGQRVSGVRVVWEERDREPWLLP